MQDRGRAWAVSAGVGCGLLSAGVGSGPFLWVLAMYWMIGSTAVAFIFGAAVRDLLDRPGMYPRSMKAIARAADDEEQRSVYRRTAAALYLYVAGMLFCAAVFCTVPLAGLVFFRK